MKEPLTLDDEVESLVAAVEPPPAPEPVVKPFAVGTVFSWLVQMRDGRVLRVDGDFVETLNGVLAIHTGLRGAGVLIAAFEYGDWKRVAIMDRTTGENDGWTVLKEKERRRP